MSEKPANAITINVVHGGKEKDKKLLEGCYFVPKGDGLYDFHDQKGDLLRRDVEQTKTFEFDLVFHWIVAGRDFLISNTAAFGDWTHPDPGKADDPEGESGSFQAQAGGSGATVSATA